MPLSFPHAKTTTPSHLPRDLFCRKYFACEVYCTKTSIGSVRMMDTWLTIQWSLKTWMSWLHWWCSPSPDLPPLPPDAPGCTLLPSYNPEKCKSTTKVQTLGELRMRDTANWWAGLLICVYSWSPAGSSWRVWHGLATAVDSMQESIHAVSCDFLCLQDTQRERTRSR